MIFKITDYIKLFAVEISFQLIEKLLRIILGFIMIYKLSAYLGPEEYGILLFIESNYLLFLGLSGFGLSPQIVKIFSENKNDLNDFIFNGLILSLFISFCFFIIFNLWTYFFLNFALKEGLFYISLLLFLNPIYFIEYYYNSQNKLRYNSIIRTVSFLICFAIKIIAIENNMPIHFFIGIIIFEVILVCLLLIVTLLIRKEFSIVKINLNLNIQYKIFKNSFLIFLYGLGINFFSRIDILMIQEFLTLEALGNYSGSFKIVSFFYGFPVMIANTFYPKILKLNDNSLSQKKIYFFSFWISVALFISVYFLKEEIIGRLFDSEFNSVQTIFSISIFPLLIMGISSTYVKFLYKKNLVLSLFLRSLAGIFINVLLNYIFLNIYGVIGVAYATVISIFFLELIYDYLDKRTREYHIFKLKSIFDFRVIKSIFNDPIS